MVHNCTGPNDGTFADHERASGSAVSNNRPGPDKGVVVDLHVPENDAVSSQRHELSNLDIMCHQIRKRQRPSPNTRVVADASR